MGFNEREFNAGGIKYRPNRDKFYSYNNYQLNKLHSTNTIINVTDGLELKKQGKTTENKGSSIDLEGVENDIFPLFFNNIEIIYVPKTLKRHLEKEIPKSLLKAIDEDIHLAIEKCLVIASNLVSTYFVDEKWKTLYSNYLSDQVKRGRDNTHIYKKVLNALCYSGKNNPVIEISKKEGRETYSVGYYSKSYRFTEPFLSKGITEYKIIDESLIKRRWDVFYKRLLKLNDNVITKNLLHIYSKIELPSEEEIISEAKRLVKNKYKTNKGKLLTFLNKHSKSYYSNPNDRSFVEESINTFRYLTKNNLMIPTVGDEKSGGRVVDSFTLMPSWIRSLVRLEGEKIAEIDFKALHPNIAMILFEGSKKYLTHQLVSEESGIDITKVKKEHLSFFNDRVHGMKRSSLYGYYKKTEPKLLSHIESLKWQYGHKSISMMLFAKEVEIITECIKRLNERGVYVGYVYDALFCKESQRNEVIEVMNKVAVDLGVYTTAM